MNSIEEIKNELEKSDLSSSERDEIFSLLENIEARENEVDGKSMLKSKVDALNEELRDEDDWRKRASLSAQIISEKLDKSDYYK